MADRFDYPQPPRLDLVERLHGVTVADPFRPLEHAHDPATRAWVEAENLLTQRTLDGPLRNRLVERLRTLHRYPRCSAPAVRGDRVFFTYSDGTINQPRLYVREEAGGSGLEAGALGLGVGDVGRVLVDPNVLDADGTTAVTEFEPDDEGGRVAYALSLHGSDRQELQIVDVSNGRVLPDRIRWVKFASIAWSGDRFFYTRFAEPGTVPPEQEQYFCQVWLHCLGEPQSADRLVYHRPDRPEVVFDLDVTADARHLVITSREGASDKAEVHVCRLTPDGSGYDELLPLITGFADGWHFVDGRGRTLWFCTDAGAPLGRVVAIDLDLDDPARKPRTIVPESGDTIVEAAVSAGRLRVHSLHNASSRLDTFDLDGQNRRELVLPGIGTILGIGARWDDRRSFLTFMSFITPPQILSCDVAAERIGPPLVPYDSAVDATQYVTEQESYPSKDGSSISMFLVRKREPDGAAGSSVPAPVLLTGYGGFNISLTPTFDPSDFLWLDSGGTLAVAHLRGGGEYGEAWHEAGMRERKQTVFDDFIAAAEWLHASGRAIRGRIAIEGGSNGGLLVGAALVQRPDLFGAAVCRVPVADMLRYHLFTVGRFWIPEYGSADDPEQFAYLLRYSPYHNVVDGVAYPPTLVMTADTDDRVDPGMAKKFAARLQEAVRGTSGGPILLRVETRAGHGAGKPVSKLVDEQADIYAFLLRASTPA